MEESDLLKSQGFQVLKEINQGAFARIFLVNNPELGIVAAKVFKNEDFNTEEWDTAGILSKDPTQICPFINQSILAKQFESMTVIFMDYCNMRTLFDLIKTQKDIPIPVIRAMMKQILEGIRYIHSKGIIHRDIKGGNILLHSPPGSGKVILKISGFDIVQIQEHIGKEMMMDVAGTTPFMAPEFHKEDDQGQTLADEKVDIWSAGILFHQLITHSFPFKSPKQVDITQFIEAKHLERPDLIKDNITWDLLTKMLSFDRKERISAENALHHPFFTGEQAKAEILPSAVQLAKAALEALQKVDTTVTLFDADASFSVPLVEIQKIIGMVDPEADMTLLQSKISQPTDSDKFEQKK
ncbi:MAG: putative Serine/Threonine kinase domain protein [Streblomastix strix]|uniref:Putative Serine/Threonine kinase domain protein n=1 Tax=Streblomastix strix TaxID=222440 RepID=A0A5J4VJ35_9EUKA|nr:MAG: putative Serine/Threonine kinase domain protein [Streblomastix strix]